jgi:hypothetical protein
MRPSDKIGAETFYVARQRMLREVCELLDSLTREFPLLLSLGDLHWADFQHPMCEGRLTRRAQKVTLAK